MALAFLRRHQRWFHVLLGIVILGFILVYIPMFQDANAGATEEVGRVADMPITAMEYDLALRRVRGRYEQMYGSRLDPNMLRMLGLENQVFDGLVDQRVIEIEARRRGIAISDRELAEYVGAEMPELQENGRFIGAERLRQLLEAQGQTLADFERALRSDLMRRRLQSLVTDGVTVTPAEVEQEYRRRNEEIKAEYVVVGSDTFSAQVTATDDEVRARFEGNKEAYRIPETRVAAYVFIDPQALRAEAAVTPADIEAHYKSRRDEYTDKEQVCARHVLVKVKGASETEGRSDEEAQKATNELLTQLRGGGDFAAIAKKSSEDTGSAQNGGSLGCFPRGTMVNEFENVAFNLELNTLSDPVKSQYGYHIIQVTEKRAEKVKGLDEVKESIRIELAGQRAQALVQQKTDALAAALAKGTGLEEAAKANGLPVQTSAPARRGEPALPLTIEAVKRLFELKPEETSREPIASSGGSIFIALKEVKPARVPELTEVQDQVKTDVVKAKSLELARVRAQELKAKAETGGLAKAASGLGLTRKETASPVKRGEPLGEVPMTAAVEDAAFTLAASTVSEPIALPNGFVVLRVTEKKAFDPAGFEKDKASVAASLRAEKRSQLFSAYLAQARQKITIERRPDVLRRIAG